MTRAPKGVRAQRLARRFFRVPRLTKFRKELKCRLALRSIARSYGTPTSALMRTAHLLDGDLDTPPLLRVIPVAVAIALNSSLRGFQFGLLAMRAQQAAGKDVDFIHLHGRSSSYCRRRYVARRFRAAKSRLKGPRCLSRKPSLR